MGWSTTHLHVCPALSLVDAKLSLLRWLMIASDCFMSCCRLEACLSDTMPYSKFYVGGGAILFHLMEKEMGWTLRQKVNLPRAPKTSQNHERQRCSSQKSLFCLAKTRFPMINRVLRWNPKDPFLDTNEAELLPRTPLGFRDSCQRLPAFQSLTNPWANGQTPERLHAPPKENSKMSVRRNHEQAKLKKDHTQGSRGLVSVCQQTSWGAQTSTSLFA